jgi:hypothetical protein
MFSVARDEKKIMVNLHVTKIMVNLPEPVQSRATAGGSSFELLCGRENM